MPGFAARAGIADGAFPGAPTAGTVPMSRKKKESDVSVIASLVLWRIFHYNQELKENTCYCRILFDKTGTSTIEEEDGSMRRLLICILCLSLLCSVAQAASVMKRGSRGEGVLELQEWLIELGYLDGEADGKFGKMTEAAVKAYQKSVKKKQTGKLTAAEADEVMYLWMDITGAMEGDGLGEDELKEIYPDGCAWTEAETEYCWRHFELGRQYALLSLDLPDKAVLLLTERLIPQYEEAIQTLYDEWAETDPDVAAEQQENFETFLAEHEEQMVNAYGAGSATVMKDLATWLHSTCVDLCFDIHTAEGNLF